MRFSEILFENGPFENGQFKNGRIQGIQGIVFKAVFMVFLRSLGF